jgi:small subunit ribosomal protein S16
MLAMRLARTGAKKKPSYRVVVIEKTRPRDSRSVEIIGHYNPTKNPIELSLNDERVQHWLGVGAQPSQTVKRLIAYKANPPAPKEAKPPAAKQAKPVAKAEAQPVAAAAAAPESSEGTAAPESSEGTAAPEAAPESAPEPVPEAALESTPE